MNRKTFVICTFILFGTLFTSCTPDDGFEELISATTGDDGQTQQDPCKGNCDD